MNAAKPFQVINCLSQGYAVACPATTLDADLEMVRWGMAADKARELADELNQAGAHRLPEHRRD